MNPLFNKAERAAGNNKFTPKTEWENIAPGTCCALPKSIFQDGGIQGDFLQAGRRKVFIGGSLIGTLVRFSA
jgi:hypothetical protein